MNYKVQDFNFSVGEISTGTNSNGQPYKRLPLTATFTGGSVISRLQRPINMALFDSNITELETEVKDLVNADSTPCFLIPLYSVKPYTLESNDNMRLKRMAIPCEWCQNDEGVQSEDTALLIAQALVGGATRTSEAEAIEAYQIVLEQKTAKQLEARQELSEAHTV